MHPARPRAPSRPCPACGAAVDPLRAGEVVLLEDGFRYLCDEACREKLAQGERARAARAPEPERQDERPSSTQVRLEGRASQTPLAVPLERPSRVMPAPQPERARWVGLGLAALALLLGAVPGPLWLGGLSAALTCSVAVLTVRTGRTAGTRVGTVGSVVGPAGVALAAVAALLARLEGPAGWSLAGAAVASAAIMGRAWLDQRARQPVDDAVRMLLAPLPARVRVPVETAESPMEVGAAEVDTADVRAGEEVLALEGEIVAVDGVVKNGEAWVWLHPGANALVRRRPGDPLLAGAQVVEGAVRLLVTRVGDDRALVRPSRFGDAESRGAAPSVRLATRIVRWGGLAAVLGALAGLAFTDAGLAGQLSIVAAVLMAAPLLALHRAAESPLVAAAASAGERGIVFQNANALERAGRATVAVLCTHGTVTEGEPEVVEVHPIDGNDPMELLALAAATETAAEDHPIARAVLRLAEARGVEPESVRRATWLPGRGVTALGPGGEPIVIGNRQLLLDEGVSVAVADAEAAHAEGRGHTALFMGVGGRVRAVLALQDNVRLGARAAVQRTFDQGMEVVLLSGDHRATVESIAKTLDVAHVKAELPPEDRDGEIRRLRETGGPVAVVGHPGPDDAALSAADVPVVLGAAGGPAGERGIALASDDLRDAAAALWIARAARTEARRAVLVSVGVGAPLVAAAALGLAVPAVAALFAVAVDAFALPAGARLLRRIELRVPTRT